MLTSWGSECIGSPVEREEPASFIMVDPVRVSGQSTVTCMMSMDGWMGWDVSILH